MNPPGPSPRAATAPPSWGELQTALASALLDARFPVPEHLVGPDGRCSPRRFGVYRNNVAAGLVHALRAGFPAIARIVGDAFFDAMAREYALQHPPRTPVMLEYGAGFPDFMTDFEPASGLPYLRDVARLEWAWTEAYHAAEASPLLSLLHLQGLDPRLAGGLRLHMHPSARVVRSPYPALTIWEMNIGARPVAPISLSDDSEDVLIVRPHALVQVRTVPPGSAVFIQALVEGLTLGQALEQTLADTDAFDLAGTLSGLITSGACIAPLDPDGLQGHHDHHT